MKFRMGKRQAGFLAAFGVGVVYVVWAVIYGSTNANSPRAEVVDSGDTKTVADLLKNGADPNVPITRHEEKVRLAFWDEVSYRWDGTETIAAFFDRPQQESLLWLATERNHPEIVHLLLQHGANVDLAGNDHNTALINAANKGNVKLVKILLAAGAKVNDEGKYGITPLTSAVSSADDTKHVHGESNYAETVQCMIASGANVNKAMGWGGNLSPLRCAQMNHRDDIVTILSKAGAK